MTWAVMDTRLGTEVDTFETEAEAHDTAAELNKFSNPRTFYGQALAPARYAVAFVEADGCKEGILPP